MLSLGVALLVAHLLAAYTCFAVIYFAKGLHGSMRDLLAMMLCVPISILAIMMVGPVLCIKGMIEASIVSPRNWGRIPSPVKPADLLMLYGSYGAMFLGLFLALK